MLDKSEKICPTNTISASRTCARLLAELFLADVFTDVARFLPSILRRRSTGVSRGWEIDKPKTTNANFEKSPPRS